MSTWMFSIVLQMTLVILLSHVARAGNPIPVFDDMILCFGRPPPEDAGWPNGYYQEDYRSAIRVMGIQRHHSKLPQG